MLDPIYFFPLRRSTKTEIFLDIYISSTTTKQTSPVVGGLEILLAHTHMVSGLVLVSSTGRVGGGGWVSSFQSLPSTLSSIILYTLGSAVKKSGQCQSSRSNFIALQFKQGRGQGMGSENAGLSKRAGSWRT